MTVRRPGRPWTAEERETLREMFPTEPIATIAHKLNRTRNAVLGMAGHMKLRRSIRRI
jgi:hypothetical protein